MLHEVPLFSSVSRAELRSIANLGTRATVKKDKNLTEQGRPGREFFLVVSGTARCLINGIEVARFGPGDFFGEMALLDGQPRTATVVATSPMDVLVLDRREFSTLLDESPTISRKLLQAMATRQRPVAGVTQ
jgi:CRP/FNR family cyclic AMP-dependent transcriptional regulator